MEQRKFAISFFIAFITMYAILSSIGFRHMSDDAWFSAKALTEKSYIDFLKQRYYTWSSRTPIEFVLLNIINRFELWKALNSLFFGVLIASSSTPISKSIKQTISVTIALLAIMYFIPSDSTKYGALWMTGSINYLWPMSLCALGWFSIYCLSNGIGNKPAHYALIFMSFILSSFNEQVAVVNILGCFITTFFIYKNKEYLTGALIAAFATIIVLLFIATAPGNEVRLVQEATNRFPDFLHFNMIEKFILGANLYFDQMIYLALVIYIILVCSIAILDDKKYIPLYAGLIISIIAVHFLLKSNTSEIAGNNNSLELDSASIYSLHSLLRFAFISLCSLFLLLRMLVLSFKSRINFATIPMFICSAASTAMLGMSPTVYASGQRVLYLSLVMTCAIVVIHITEKIRK